jgi:hypothetical protein
MPQGRAFGTGRLVAASFMFARIAEAGSHDRYIMVVIKDTAVNAHPLA